MTAAATSPFYLMRWSTYRASDLSRHQIDFHHSFLDAKEDLLKAALIERFDDATISVHRLVQSAIMNWLSTQEKTELADYMIRLLIKRFPNTWQSDLGHQYSAWKACEMCLPHVKFLVRQVRNWKFPLKDSQKFTDLGLRCCW